MSRFWFLLAAAIVGVTACGTNTPATHAATPPTSTPTSTRTASPTATPTPTATAAAASSTCQSSQFTASVVGTNGAAGTIYGVIGLKNTGTTCTTEGFVTMQMSSSAGSAITTTVVDSSSPPAPWAGTTQSSLTVAAGATIYFGQWYNHVTASPAGCPTSATVAITLPASTGVTELTISEDPCSNGTINVTPLTSTALSFS